MSNPATAALRAHHDELERAFDVLVDQTQHLDRPGRRAAWRQFEGPLLSHLEYEERELLPPYELEIPHAAATIRREHAEIRAALRGLAARLEVGELRGEAVTDFVARLRDHARCEEQTLHPWALTHPSAAGWKTLDRPLGV